MQWKNTNKRYGLIAMSLHWLVALIVFGLFTLGLWMTGLDYYHQWYKQGPDLHKSIGILLFIAVLFRLFWRWFSAVPQALDSHKAWEVRLAHYAHLSLYFLLLAIMISGYLISTADGRAIDVFNFFSIPATITSIANQEDIAGQVHFVLALALIALVMLHVAGALKHQFIDRDNTLKRMLGK